MVNTVLILQTDQGIEQLNNLPNITWPLSGRATFEPWQSGSSIHALTYYAMLPCLSIFMELSDWKVPVWLAYGSKNREK